MVLAIRDFDQRCHGTTCLLLWSGHGVSPAARAGPGTTACSMSYTPIDGRVLMLMAIADIGCRLETGNKDHKKFLKPSSRSILKRPNRLA